MAIATYSINVGTIKEASSAGYISTVLDVLPDNTQKQISPRDVRNAVFSNWENSTFRYTLNNNSTQYIGLGRDNIYDTVFLGKQKISGSYIMTDALLASDTDIFLYNTKTDANPSQDFKLSFLAGNDQAAHPYAPYIEVAKIGGTAAVSLTMAHNNPFGGNFNFQSGNTGRISLNNLIFPSVNEVASMVASPAQSTSGDLFIVRSASGFVEIKSASFSGSALPSFTNLAPTPQDLGGIPTGSTFSNVPIIQMLNMLLYPYLGPLSTTTLPSTYLERNHVSNTPVNYSYSLTKRSAPLTSVINIISDVATLYNGVGPSIGGPGYISNNYASVFTFSNAQVQANLSGLFTFSVIPTDGTQSYTSSAGVKFVYPYFHGFSSTTSNTQNIISNDLTKEVNDYASQSVSLSGTGYLFYCYPETYGDLAAIYDGNDFLLWQTGSASSTWTYSTAAGINSPSAIWSGVSYRIYRTTSEVTIPLPSQNYKFNF